LPESATALRRAIELQPDFVGAHTTLASVLRQMGDTAGADAAQKESARLSKEKNSLQGAVLATNSGKRMLAAGDVDGAVSQFRNAVRLSPSFAAAHYQLGMALTQKGQKDEAMAEFKRASDLDPRLQIPPQ